MTCSLTRGISGTQHPEEFTIKILFLTQFCPYPPSNGGAVKTYNILRHLGSKHDVSLLTFVRRESEREALSQLSKFCREMDYCWIDRSTARNVLDASGSLLRGRSFIISRDWRDEMYRKVLAFLRSGSDLIYIDHLQMSQYIPPDPPCPVLLDEHNVEWRIMERYSQTGGSLSERARRVFASLEWPKLRRYEINACRNAHRVLTVTSKDRDTLMENGVRGDKITFLPIGVDTEYFRPVPLKNTSAKVLSFGTMSWPPNIDSMLYFTRSIYPAVREAAPNVTFSIVGANPPAEVAALGESDPSIRVTGFVDDIRDEARDSAVFVVPLRIGSGMRVKILDAMAMGLPVVTTSIGCEGIPVISGEHALVADTPEDFSTAVLSLLNDPAQRVRLGISGRKFVEENFSWPPILHRLDEIISSLALP